jgi:hypothetical protein
MADRARDEDLELLEELGVDTAPVSSGGRTARDQRILAGFEDIERFVKEHGRLPEHGEDKDIFERLYAVRLDRIRSSPECREALKGLGSHGLLGPATKIDEGVEKELDDEELLAELGVEEPTDCDVTKLVHVRSREEINAAEEIAQRTRCEEFDQFKPIFEKVQREIESGVRKAVKYEDYSDIKTGDMFILGGQKAIVAELGEKFMSDYERENRRLRVIFDNGTENRYLLRSFVRALYKIPGSRRITEPGAGPLFAEVLEADDVPSGSIYVLRSKSDHPFIVENGSVVHKIGLAGNDVKVRIANAKKSPTYLLADVQIVQVFKLANVDRKGLEAVLHKFFASARLDMELKDRFGSQVEPKEWFLVPLPAIEDAIEKIIDGTIGEFRYDPKSARIVPAEQNQKAGKARL